MTSNHTVRDQTVYMRSCYASVEIPFNRESKETYGQTRRLTRELINSSQKQFTCFYKMFCCFQHFSWSNIVKLIMVLFNFIGMVCDSFIGFGRVFTTEFTSAGTLTTLP